MTGPAVQVCVNLGEAPILAGFLHVRGERGREGATFRYDDRWLQRPDRYALEPGLMLGPGPLHTAQGRALFGALGDSAPDRWGRTLLDRAERRQAAREGRAPRALREIDYLLGVSDFVRIGALRFRLGPEAPFLAEGGPEAVPPLVRLGALLAASDRFEGESDTVDDLRLLLAPGSSLGGARPKASVLDQGRLCIAKFPSSGDTHDVVRWEAVALGLAARAGIPVPTWRLVTASRRPVLLLERFDRAGTRRIPFLSMMSLMGGRDGETWSYEEMADALRQHGAAPAHDLPGLWRRMVFNILVSNFDDHLRNHAVLGAGLAGWRLAPAYDLNPLPAEVRPRVMTTAIGADHDLTASLERCLSVAGSFRLKGPEARKLIREVGKATRGWRAEARRHGLARREVDRMATAFEHADSVLALRR